LGSYQNVGVVLQIRHCRIFTQLSLNCSIDLLGLRAMLALVFEH